MPFFTSSHALGVYGATIRVDQDEWGPEIEMHFEDLTPEQRALAPHQHIDPGFLNRRLCFSTFSPWLSENFNRLKLPGDDFMTLVSNDHLIVTLVLAACASSKVPSLGAVLASGSSRGLFCSTEVIAPAPEIYEAERVRSRILPAFPCERQVLLDYHTSHLVSDTGKMRLHKGSTLSVVAGIDSVSDREIIARPLIIGDPTYQHQFNKDIDVDLLWYGWDWYKIFPGDISEFERCREFPNPDTEEWSRVMRELPEQKVKEGLCQILGDLVRTDWAGEQADHFTSLHVGSKEMTAAFLLKGPKGGRYFREMTCDMLGTRADQVYRLACTPADMLVVQHCHQIGEAVRDMVRAFAVVPPKPRRYCLIDGKDTYRILKAYDRI